VGARRAGGCSPPYWLQPPTRGAREGESEGRRRRERERRCERRKRLQLPMAVS